MQSEKRRRAIRARNESSDDEEKKGKESEKKKEIEQSRDRRDNGDRRDERKSDMRYEVIVEIAKEAVLTEGISGKGEMIRGIEIEGEARAGFLLVIFDFPCF